MACLWGLRGDSTTRCDVCDECVRHSSRVARWSKNAKKDAKKDVKTRFRDDVLETTRRRRFARFSAQQLTVIFVPRHAPEKALVASASERKVTPMTFRTSRSEYGTKRGVARRGFPDIRPIHVRSLILCRFAKAQKHRAPPSVWASRRCATTRRSARARSRGLSSARAGSRPGSCGLPRRAARRFRARPPVRPSRRGRTPRRERGGFRAPRRGDGRASRPPRRFRTRARPRRLPRPAAGFVRCASPSSERRARRAAWTIEGEKTSSWRVWRSNRRAPSGVNARRRTRTDTNTNASNRRTGARREKRATRTPRRDCLPVRPFTNARTSRRRRMRRRRLVGLETNARCPRTSTA